MIIPLTGNKIQRYFYLKINVEKVESHNFLYKTNTMKDK